MKPYDTTPHRLLNSDRKYIVPDFQRPFSWSKDEIGDLWQDLQPLLRGIQDELFLGTLVIETSQPGTGVIWDGQQRIATLVVFLAAARDRLLRSSAPLHRDLGTAIQTQYIMGSPFAGFASPILTLGELDQPTFHDFVVLKEGDGGKKNLAFWNNLSANQRRSSWSVKVVDALELLSNLIEDFAQQNAAAYGGREEAIRYLLTVVLNKIKLISVETASETEAYRTFETLNDRGLELSAADLIKNFLLSRVHGNSVLRIQMKQWWETMARLLGERLTTFIRHYYMSKFGTSTKAELYSNIKGICEPPQGQGIPVQEFLLALKDSADFYYKLIDPANGGWTNPELLESLERLARLGASQWTPILLAAQALGLAEPDFATLTRCAEVLMIRSVFVGGANPNSLERIFGDTATTMWTSTRPAGVAPQTALATAISEIRNHTPSDQAFRQDFLELRDLSRPRARFLLECLETQAQKEASGGVVPLPSVLDLEHVYPENPGQGWPPEPGPTATPLPDYVSPSDREKIGNLTLLHFRPNRSQRNAAYSQKRPNFISSSIIITNRIQQYTSWNLQNIDDRQAQLADLAIRTWPIP